MRDVVTISVVIPTYNRPHSLERVLRSVQQFTYPISEVIVVDAGEHPITDSQLKQFGLNARVIMSRPSVCVQRNIGIKAATGEWILLCDDDLEFPSDYLNKLAEHAKVHPDAGAISGLVLQRDGPDEPWTGEYPVRSASDLLYRYTFGLSMWGRICVKENLFTRPILKWYQRKGNGLSKAGWPIVTDFNGNFFRTPFFGLGACLIKRKWLIDSPYDEALDKNGYGDNFGVAASFPHEGIHVLNQAPVHHYRDEVNRPNSSVQFYKRILALHYFIVYKLQSRVSLFAFYWSIIGLSIAFIIKLRFRMFWASLKLFTVFLFGKNPYIKGKASSNGVVTPILQ